MNNQKEIDYLRTEIADLRIYIQMTNPDTWKIYEQYRDVHKLISKSIGDGLDNSLNNMLFEKSTELGKKLYDANKKITI